MTDPRLRFLLLQVRNPGDPMREQEVNCFAKALACDPSAVVSHDLLAGPPSNSRLAQCDVVLLGGSGDYSVAAGGGWLEPILDAMRQLYDMSKPTFASCWGFQAMARALGGVVVTDMNRAELGTIVLALTDHGKEDPVFGMLPASFPGHAGHQDIVDRLPPDAVRLVRSDRVDNQAFTFPGKPIYCTQFHPELTRRSFLERLYQYPTYVKKIAGVSLAEFETGVYETPEPNRLLQRFVDIVLDKRRSS